MVTAEPPQPNVMPAYPPERDLEGLAEARVAIMITAYRIGPVLADTILSALSQQHLRPVAVLLVVDGCPETATTGAIARRYLAAYPELFHVLWLQNGGVSRARNRGLKWLLDCHPDLDAIYCLDGDDLMSTTSVASGFLALKDAQDRYPDRRFGWVVTNKLNFGDDHKYIETPERFRRTSYLAVNLSQPSCLYNADMFREGLCWDEAMRSGIEDWEFWLAAIQGDYEGVFNPRDVLYYRRLMGNRSSVNRRNDAYNIPYMRHKHAPLFGPQAVLADEQVNTPRFAFGPPDAEAFDLTSDPGMSGSRVPLDQVRNALAARLQRQAPDDYVYDPYAPDLFVVIDATMRRALQRQGLLRGVLMAASDTLSQGAAIVEGLISPLTEAQRADAAPQDAHVFQVAETPRPRAWDAARRSFYVVRPGLLSEQGGVGSSPEQMAVRTRRLLLRSDALPPVSDHALTNRQLLRMIDRLNAADAGRAESALGQAQAHSGRLYVSSRHVARHGTLTSRSIGTGPLFPQISADGKRRIAMILPPAGLSPAPARLLQTLAAGLGPAVQVSLFAMSNHLPRPAGPENAIVENVCSLMPWVNRMDFSPREHNVGVPRWENMTGSLLNQLSGVFAPFDHVISFDLQIFAPVMLKLRPLGVTTVSIQEDPGDGMLLQPAMARTGAAGRVSDDPVAALNHAAAYDRIICTSQARMDLLSALGYPLSRMDLGAEKYLDTLLPGLAAAAE